ncbi:GH92 family glycosyl hydrolase [Aurantibacillus circumpalustris]|uniref:GH92 family glycosyl hydrolase n=1 Tax=Aurantibacillus circumpalustris TaxID=3036359 RepID=UPI00295A939E|nr:GH92 family glycosyl hydrolase [Aurantibacillus circumpalustris]
MKKFFLFIGLSLLVNTKLVSQIDYSSYVNPFIGTGGHGHTFPGAVLPFGMVQLSPDTRVDGSWDGCSGYHYSDNFIYGFSHTHLSGTGCSDYGDILIMPMSGKPSTDNKIYGSKFSHANEKASPGYYEVLLDDDKIKAELTVTPRVGIHRYTFSKSQESNVVLDLLHRDKAINYHMRMIDSVTITGYRVSEAWAKKQHVYFVMKFSKPFEKMEYIVKGNFKEQLTKLGGGPQGAYFRFNTKDGKPLMVKVAISTTGIEGAIKNLEAEATHWDFDKYKKEAEAAWNTQLQKIEVSDPDKNKMTTFYTALYHTCIHPSLNIDVDGTYRGRDDLLHNTKNSINYTVFSLWDTYRALNPLMTIIEPKRVSDFINTFLTQYQQSGRLPVWELSGNETDCMIGFHSVSVIADAMLKDIKGFDQNLAYEAMKSAATYSGFGIPIFNKKGFLEIDDESESVSRTLEYAYDNWCIAQVAKKLNKPADAALYYKRSLAYYNLFDQQTGTMRPRKNGNWLTPFSPSEINNHFTEGNSWQYSFYVPHDIENLIKLHGGSEKFEGKLDELFTTKEKTSGREQADVTGLIGQYAHGNEPSHHMAYLYNYVGKPQKSIERVHQILNDFYKSAPDGLIGNEDCGQMSAWYVYSALGFYPVCPGSLQLIVGEPLFANSKLHFENGKTMEIVAAPGNGKIIKEISVNDKSSLLSYLDYTTLMKGGKIVFNYEEKTKPVKYGKGTLPPSNVSKTSIIPLPLIKSSSQVFKDQLELSISSVNTTSGICYYTLDGTEPTKKSNLYKEPFTVNKNTVVKAKTYTKSDSSEVIRSKFFKLKYDFDITIKSKANSQYAAEGSQTMMDSIIANENWRRGDWLGYQGQDFECLIDMKQEKTINYLSLNFLQDSQSWIVFPASVNFYISNDNKKFTLLETMPNTEKAENEKVQVHKFEKQLAKSTNTRYIKIVAKNFGKLPDWHKGKGGDAFIFVDELEVR